MSNASALFMLIVGGLFLWRVSVQSLAHAPFHSRYIYLDAAHAPYAYAILLLFAVFTGLGGLVVLLDNIFKPPKYLHITDNSIILPKTRFLPSRTILFSDITKLVEKRDYWQKSLTIRHGKQTTYLMNVYFGDKGAFEEVCTILRSETKASQ